MKKTIALAIFVFTTLLVFAQNKIKFSTQNYMGILAGGSETNIQLQTINGISFHKWFTGIGTGIDWYYQRSIPVFLTAERGFRVAARKNIYFSSSAGVNFPWKNNYYNDDWWGFTNSETHTGFYWNTGFGYKINIGKQNDAVLLHFGYSNKFYKETVTSNNPCLVAPCPVNTESFKYNLRTLSVKLGYGF
jgi:hypothetical protein